MSSLRSSGVVAPTARPPPVPAMPARPVLNHVNHQNGYPNGQMRHFGDPMTAPNSASNMNNINNNVTARNHVGGTKPMVNGFTGPGSRVGNCGPTPIMNGYADHTGDNSRNAYIANEPQNRNNRSSNPTQQCRAGLKAFLSAPRDTHFCALCRQGFSCADDKEAHLKSSSHNLQYMKANYAQQRNELQKDKCLVTVRADPERLETNGSATVTGKILVHLDAKADYSVRILSCDPFVRPEGVDIRHPALDLRQAIPVSPGQTVAIDVHFTTCVPIELCVPIGLKLCIDSRNSPFYIIREMTFYCSCDDLTPEAAMGDHDYEMEFYQYDFKAPEQCYAPPKVRTNNIPELPMPLFEDPFEIPAKLLPIQQHINSLRHADAPAMDDFTIQCFSEIKKLLKTQVREKNYIIKFDMMLYLEEMAKKSQLMSQNLATISLVCRENGGYQVFLPGLPERRPPISVGFRVNVRTAVDASVVYQGVFTSIEDCTAMFRMNSLFDREFKRNQKYSLEFQFNRRNFQIMHNSLKNVEDKVFAGKDSCLFPRTALLRENPRIPLVTDSELERITFFDAKVKDNPEQYQAVKTILRGTHRPAPFILFGPPGTGKTSTIAEAIKQIVTHQSSARILVCASSNSACDVICDKVLGHIHHDLIYRAYSASFEIQKISPKIKELGCHNYVNGAVAFPGEDKLRGYRVIVATLVSSWRFGELSDEFFSHVFIDECGFAMEPEALIPIYTSLGKWNDSFERRPARHLILAGDIQQLGPVLASSMVNQYLCVSLMERLMKDKNAPYQKPYDPTFIVKLLRNYRSHHNILEIPNRLFYEGELQEHADPKSSNKFINWKHLFNKQVPIVFHNCVSEERRDPHSTSYFNLVEAETVLHYVNAVLLERGVRGSDIGVITPYAAQARRIRHLFQRRLLHDVKVGSVEEFQGQERMVIILSTVRNCKDLLQRDLLQRLGFLKNPKRFNVALTRAKALLICIGNASILKRDECWATFLQYVEEHKAWAGVPSENVVVSNRLSLLALK